MRILFLTHRIPYPPNKGDKIRAFHILEYLSRRHEVWLATLVDDARDIAALPHLKERVQGIVHARIDEPGRRVIAASCAMLRSQSISVRHFYSPALQRDIDELIATCEFDAIFCSSSPTAEYLFRSRHFKGNLLRVLKIMDLIDVDSYKWSQYAAKSPVWSKWVYQYEARHLSLYERKIYDTFDHLLLVSEQEKRYYPREDDRRVLKAVGNGVDLQFFSPELGCRLRAAGPTLVFTGMMDYWPNVDGMLWFLDHVYPRIRDVIPGVRLFIVGKHPARQLRRWNGRSGVVITGFVQDVRDYLASADVCVVPLRIARGLQNKVLEAMAMGKPVICTPQALEGISAVPGEHLMAAADAEAFASATIDLLRHPDKAGELGRNARRRVEQQYSWNANLQVLDEILPLATRASRVARIG